MIRTRGVGWSLALVLASAGAAGCGVNGLIDFGSASNNGSVFPTEPDGGVGPVPPPEDDEVGGRPDFEPTVTQSVPPSPISGGTLAVSKDGIHAFAAANPDRDALRRRHERRHERDDTPLQTGDEPGRVVEDANGIVHVALRGAGMIADVDPRT